MKNDFTLAFNEIVDERALPREVVLEALSQVVVDRTRCILIASDTDYPEPVLRVRPLSELLGISLVLAPDATDKPPGSERSFRLLLGELE